MNTIGEIGSDLNDDPHELNSIRGASAPPLFREEVFAVVGCAIEVINALGHGLHEEPYENALAVEFAIRNIPYRQKPRFELQYKEQPVGEYVPDLVAFEKLVVDTRVIEKITDQERSQMLNYLKITGLPVGVVLNFKRARLEWQRLVLRQPEHVDGLRKEAELR